jgi:hypothetical protein
MMKKAAAKKPTDPSKTKPFNVRPIKPAEIIKDKPAPKKPPVKRPNTKPAPLKGPAAVAEYKRQVSPSGMKKSQVKQKQAIDKKYPGLYKKSK